MLVEHPRKTARIRPSTGGCGGTTEVSADMARKNTMTVEMALFAVAAIIALASAIMVIYGSKARSPAFCI